MVKSVQGVIAGVVGPDALTYQDSLKTALEQCEYSIPMENALWASNDVVLGCRFASVSSHLDACLFQSPSGHRVILGSGEVYNAPGLQNKSTTYDHNLSHALLPLFADLYDTDGLDFLHNVDGRYVVALWDADARRLCLARDSTGLKQLFTIRQNQHLFFASDSRVIRWLAHVSRPSVRSIFQYLVFNYPLNFRSYYEDLTSLPPGILHVESIGEPPKSITFSSSLHLENQQDYSEVLEAVVLCQIGSGEGIGYHLSGGIDTSLICHIAKKHLAVPLDTFTAYYDSRHSDVHYSQMVAAEIGARLHYVPIQPSEFRTTLEYLIRRLDGPVMAIGVPTFWFTARAAANCGVQALISGIGADHPVVGWTQLEHLPSLQEIGYDTLYQACVNVSPTTLRHFVADSKTGEAIDQIFHDFVGLIDQDLAPTSGIERFYARHFLHEHLRMAEETHADWGIDIRYPFLQNSVLALGLDLAASRENSKDKGFLRSILRRFGSGAAERAIKEQMAISLTQFRTLMRDLLVAEFAVEHRRLPGLDYHRLTALAISSGPASQDELRLLWVLYNVHTWLAAIDQDAPEI